MVGQTASDRLSVTSGSIEAVPQSVEAAPHEVEDRGTLEIVEVPDTRKPEIALSKPGIGDPVPIPPDQEMWNRRAAPGDRTEGHDVDRLRTVTGLEAGIQDLETAAQRDDQQPVARSRKGVPVGSRAVAIRRPCGSEELPEVSPARENKGN